MGFSQEIPPAWNNTLTCAVGAVLLLATCSLIGIILVICLGVSQQQQLVQHLQALHKEKNEDLSADNKNNYYGVASSQSATPSTLSLSTSSSFMGLSQQLRVVGLKCAIAFSWILPTLYCIILWFIRHVMHTYSATWWLKFATMECNLFIVNHTLLGIIFYVVLGVLIKRMLLLLPRRRALDKKFTAASASSSSTQR